jgi:hypothetical protein
MDLFFKCFQVRVGVLLKRLKFWMSFSSRTVRIFTVSLRSWFCMFWHRHGAGREGCSTAVEWRAAVAGLFKCKGLFLFSSGLWIALQCCVHHCPLMDGITVCTTSLKEFAQAFNKYLWLPQALFWALEYRDGENTLPFLK